VNVQRQTTDMASFGVATISDGVISSGDNIQL
jgi:hypothetical protein